MVAGGAPNVARDEAAELLIEHLGDGFAYCLDCGSRVSVAAVEPLDFRPCPDCGKRLLCPAVVEGYWLVRYLASGGMGVVYLAYHEDAGPTPYAVKLARPHRPDDSDPVENLRHEIEVLTAMEEHPCMVRVVAARSEGSQPFLAMDYVDGEGLDRQLDNGRPVGPVDALGIGLNILAAETNIVHQGYLYRDLKPGNIILTHDTRSVLCDFGICLPLDKVGADDSEMLQGSPHYVPPERLTGSGEEPASEIYSLGMVLYHIVTGRPFFHGLDIADVPQQHVDVDDDDRAARLAPLGAPLGSIILEMIRREPGDRYRSFLELERDLFAAWTAASGIVSPGGIGHA